MGRWQIRGRTFWKRQKLVEERRGTPYGGGDLDAPAHHLFLSCRPYPRSCARAVILGRRGYLAVCGHVRHRLVCNSLDHTGATAVTWRSLSCRVRGVLLIRESKSSSCKRSHCWRQRNWLRSCARHDRSNRSSEMFAKSCAVLAFGPMALGDGFVRGAVGAASDKTAEEEDVDDVPLSTFILSLSLSSSLSGPSSSGPLSPEDESVASGSSLRLILWSAATEVASDNRTSGVRAGRSGRSITASTVHGGGIIPGALAGGAAADAAGKGANSVAKEGGGADGVVAVAAGGAVVTGVVTGVVAAGFFAAAEDGRRAFTWSVSRTLCLSNSRLCSIDSPARICPSCASNRLSCSCASDKGVGARTG